MPKAKKLTHIQLVTSASSNVTTITIWLWFFNGNNPSTMYSTYLCIRLNVCFLSFQASNTWQLVSIFPFTCNIFLLTVFTAFYIKLNESKRDRDITIEKNYQSSKLIISKSKKKNTMLCNAQLNMFR